MRRPPARRHYSRTARLNELLREVLGDAIEVESGSDSRLDLVTVTAVDCDPDLRHARVYFASLPSAAKAALAEVRPRLQAAIARQVRAKRTPHLSFEADPAVAYGERVETVLRELRAHGELDRPEPETPEPETPEHDTTGPGSPAVAETAEEPGSARW
ncbi:MAG TPA: 30S ribosome-binding factor RbfA [Acidimicrobiales bacterium]|nr:30S ribosome-binding factor RbfA [Acidimicrobiales bacterium]